MLHSVTNGELIPIVEVDDEVFSKKMLGDGYAIKPASSNIFSPIEGLVTSIFPTKHAIGLKTEHDLEILVHIGIDTVELKGEPFEIYVKEGDLVNNETLLATVDLNKLQEHNKQSDILIIITGGNYSELAIQKKALVTEHDIIGEVR